MSPVRRAAIAALIPATAVAVSLAAPVEHDAPPVVSVPSAANAVTMVATNDGSDPYVCTDVSFGKAGDSSVMVGLDYVPSDGGVGGFWVAADGRIVGWSLHEDSCIYPA